MGSRHRGPVLVFVAVAAIVAMLGGAIALQLLSGGIRPRMLGPVVLSISLAALGALLSRLRPEVRFGPLLALTGLTFALGSLAASALDYGSVHPIPHLAAEWAFATVSFTRVGLAAWVAFIVWFPDERFTSRGWRRFFVVSATLCVATALMVWLVGPPDRVFDFYAGTSVPAAAGGPFAGGWSALGTVSDLLLLLPLVALSSLVQRYRRAGAVLRQQVRWLLLATAVTVIAQIAGAALFAQQSEIGDVGLAVSIVSQPLPVIAATLAILRHRLWDIDLVVSGALVYGVLWAVLSALLLVPALAAGLLVGGSGAAAAVGIALLVTVLFHPARRRLEGAVERLVFRHRVRPYVLLSGFWETLRVADLNRLGPLVAEAVRSGLHVEWAEVWMFAGTCDGGSLRPLGPTRTGTAEIVTISTATAAHLYDAAASVLSDALAAELAGLWVQAPEAVIPLAAGEDLVGLLACGGRRGERLGPSDFEALEMIARQVASRLRNLSLQTQLRERLAEIELQAAELLRSRQRLVTAQGEERRRIERNLHDGVQQQLVSLAARLHRAAAHGEPGIADLAAEAEEAVFALQELGRGIYPSVLADQGLPAALRTQAARMPLPVHLQIDDVLLDRRLDREIEAALYFVALEALTNAYKHARGPSVSIRLRAGSEAFVFLDVVDGGVGFDHESRGGSGLQNMHDRIAAAGGTLAVQSKPGHGTRVSASIAGAVPPAAPALTRSRPAPANRSVQQRPAG